MVRLICFFLVSRRPLSSTRTGTRCPYTTRFRSFPRVGGECGGTPFHAVDAVLDECGGLGDAVGLLVDHGDDIGDIADGVVDRSETDRKSTRLNSSHYCPPRMLSPA